MGRGLLVDLTNEFPKWGSGGASEPLVEGSFSKIIISVIPDMLLKLTDVGRCHRGAVLQGARGRAQGFVGHSFPVEPAGEFPEGLRGTPEPGHVF